MPDRPNRTLIRRKPAVPRSGELNLDAVQALIDATVEQKLEPMRKHIEVLLSNSYTLCIMLDDMSSATDLAVHTQGSTKARLEEFLTSLQSTLNNLGKMLNADATYYEKEGSIRSQFALLEASEMLTYRVELREDGDEGEDDIDPIMEDVSESEGFTVRPRRRR